MNNKEINKSILKNNDFRDLSNEELRNLWNGLKRTYVDGYYAEDNPLTPYKEKAFKESPLGLTIVQLELLRAIAVRFVG